MEFLVSRIGSNQILYHIVVIIFAAFAAFIPRYFPIHFFSSRKIPEWFNEWMKYVPVSLFTALVVKDLFLNSSYAFIGLHSGAKLIAALLVVLVAYRSRSMGLSVVCGLVAVALLTWAFGMA